MSNTSYLVVSLILCLLEHSVLYTVYNQDKEGGETSKG